MLFRFGEGVGSVTLGAVAVDRSGAEFAPGTTHDGVHLEFWAAGEAKRVVVPGTEFIVCYSGDIGRGRITSLP